jgi:hypothetical protein
MQNPATGPYHDPTESSRHLISVGSILIVTSHLSRYLPLKFSNENFCYISHCVCICLAFSSWLNSH